MANFQFTLSSGRRLGITGMGNPRAKRVVVFCHSAPGSSHFDPDPVASASHDVHILAFDRPGYGSSDPLPPDQWPSVSGAADDISEYLHSSEETAQALNKHELDSVGAGGWSAGGRVALALAAKHPDLIDRVAVVATPAPNDQVQWIDPELSAMSDHLATLPPDAAIEQLVGMFEKQMANALPPADPEESVPLDFLGAGPSAGDANAAALAYPGARERLDGMLRDAFRQGPVGAASDILSYTARPWGFDLAAVRAKTLLLYGDADAVAGHAHAIWYRKHLADARVEMVPDIGHLLIIPTWARVLAHLAPEGVGKGD